MALVLCIIAASKAQLPAPELSAENLLMQYSEAIGWNEQSVKEAISNSIEIADIRIVEAGIKIHRKAIKTSDGKFYSEASAPQIGKIIRGFDGEVFWEKATTSGLRSLEGNELAIALDESVLHRYANFRKVLKSYKFSGTESVNDEEAYKLEVITVNDNHESWYFSKDSKLLVRTAVFLSLPQGNFDVITDYSDYREAGGLLYPFRQHIRFPGQTREYNVSSLVHNGEVEASVFNMPLD